MCGGYDERWLNSERDGKILQQRIGFVSIEYWFEFSERASLLSLSFVVVLFRFEAQTPRTSACPTQEKANNKYIGKRLNNNVHSPNHNSNS